MEKQKITLEVPPDTARVFNRATPEQRRRAAQAVRFALLQPAQAADELERLLDDLAAQARAGNLTEDKLKDLLDDE